MLGKFGKRHVLRQESESLGKVLEGKGKERQKVQVIVIRYAEEHRD